MMYRNTTGLQECIIHASKKVKRAIKFLNYRMSKKKEKEGARSHYSAHTHNRAQHQRLFN